MTYRCKNNGLTNTCPNPVLSPNEHVDEYCSICIVSSVTRYTVTLG